MKNDVRNRRLCRFFSQILSTIMWSTFLRCFIVHVLQRLSYRKVHFCACMYVCRCVCISITVRWERLSESKTYICTVLVLAVFKFCIAQDEPDISQPSPKDFCGICCIPCRVRVFLKRAWSLYIERNHCKCLWANPPCTDIVVEVHLIRVYISPLQKWHANFLLL